MGETIGFIGLGQLGLPLATNLLSAGYALRVYNRTASKAESLVREGAQLAPRPVDAVTTGGIITSAGYSLREALSMAEKNGVDPKAVVDMLTQTLFPAPIYQSYGKRIAENTAPFSHNEIPLKDVGLFKKAAQQVESPTPIASLLHDLLRSDEGRA